MRVALRFLFRWSEFRLIPLQGKTRITALIADASETSDILMKVTLSQVNDSICNRTHKDMVKLRHGYLKDQQMCVGRLEGGRDTCQVGCFMVKIMPKQTSR